MLHFQLSAGVSYATQSLVNTEICHFFWDQCNHRRWLSVINRKHPSFCSSSLKQPAANSPLLVSTAHFCALRNTSLHCCLHPCSWQGSKKKLRLHCNRFGMDNTPCHLCKLFLQRLRLTQRQGAPAFTYRDETSSSLTRKWGDVTWSSSWISSISALCTMETSRELSATTAVPHSHHRGPEHDSLPFPSSCCRQRAKDCSQPSLVRQGLESNAGATCTKLE